MYDFLTFLSEGIIWIASLFSKKISLMCAGRRETFARVSSAVKGYCGGGKRFWVHCASLGEFEQGRPVVERLRRRFPDAFIGVSFFSPSGYEVRKGYDVADVVFYLPADTKHNMKRLSGLIKADALFIVKYEYWYNMINQVKRNGGDVYLFSALFQRKMVFFKWYGGFFRRILKLYNHIYVQDSCSKELLREIGISGNVSITSDTRFDRVVENRDNVKDLPLIKDFCKGDREVVICGSTWNADMDILIPFILESRGVKFVIAPHEIEEENIRSIESALMPRGVLRYSQTTKYDNLECPHVMIVDCIGILNSVYQYGNRAYIGGGFGAGIHNILEAAVWGLPLMFGPNYERFKEAVDLVELHGARVIHSVDDLRARFSDKRSDLDHASEVASSYVVARKGGSDLILNTIFGKANGTH